jgi:ectoine hydroxylase-related dioxygenase (phytanoyl-CoA dioxygenase family)
MEFEPEAWAKAYEEDGFVVVRDVLDAARLAEVRAEFLKVAGNVENVPPHLREKLFFERQHVINNRQYYEGVLTPEECGDAVRQVEDLALFHPAFAELICHPPVLDVLEVLFGSTEFSFNYLTGRPKEARVGNGISDGNFHRDTPSEEFTAVNTVLVILCLDEMSADNGATAFVPGSHRVSDEEAKRPRWRDVDRDGLKPEEKVPVNCPAGSGVFFNTKVLHAAGHNRSERTRHAILSEWVGPGVLPTSPERHAYQGLRPRSKDPAFVRQMRMTFPGLFAGRV